jgi:hypothetical protein
MGAAATLEDTTEKSAVTPGPLAPAHELFGDMLMDARQPAEALKEYETALRRNRIVFDRCTAPVTQRSWPDSARRRARTISNS